MTNCFLKIIIAVGLTAPVLHGCSVQKQIPKESSVGIINYNQYSIKTSSPAATDTSFFVIANQEEFNATFSSSTGEGLAKPDFSGQTAVAIAMPPPAAAKIDRASIQGDILNIFASACNTSNTDCPKNGLALATTPRSTMVKSVRFFVNGVNLQTVKMH